MKLKKTDSGKYATIGFEDGTQRDGIIITVEKNDVKVLVITKGNGVYYTWVAPEDILDVRDRLQSDLTIY